MHIRDKEQMRTTTKLPKRDTSDNESISGMNVKQRKSVKMELLAAASLKAAEEAVEAASALAVARASLQMKKQTYCNGVVAVNLCQKIAASSVLLFARRWMRKMTRLIEIATHQFVRKHNFLKMQQ